MFSGVSGSLVKFQPDSSNIIYLCRTCWLLCINVYLQRFSCDYKAQSSFTVHWKSVYISLTRLDVQYNLNYFIGIEKMCDGRKRAEQCWPTIELTDTGADQTTERARNMLSFLKLIVRRIMVVKEAILVLHKSSNWIMYSWTFNTNKVLC